MALEKMGVLHEYTLTGGLFTRRFIFPSSLSKYLHGGERVW